MKPVTFRQLQKKLGQTTDKLRPGESQPVTKHGKLHGFYVRAGTRKRRIPDMLAHLKKSPITKQEGQRAIEMMLADL